MSVIVELDVQAMDFELGRVLAVPGRARIKLEDIVPLGGQIVPLFWLYQTDAADFVESVRGHEKVNGLIEFDETADRILYALTWDPNDDQLLSAVSDYDGFLLKGSGSGTRWSIQIRFPDHDSLSSFDDTCRKNDIGFEVERVYNPTPPEAGQWYGLSTAQRETLLLAVREGYFAIPREITTKELGDELGVSDQAVIERLRRAVTTLADNTILSDHQE